MSSPFRSWAPPPMPNVPFMPQAQVGPQQIALGLPQSAPATPAAAPPPAPSSMPGSTRGGFFAQPGGLGTSGGYFNSPTTQMGPGWSAMHPTAPPPQASMDPRSFSAGYRTPMQLAAARQTAQAGQPQHTFNPQLANLGLGLMGGGSVASMLPQIMQMWRNK